MAMVPFSFAGVALMALRGGAVFWPARRALIVADLHFEKASWFAGHGQFLPPYDSRATLEALAQLLRLTGAGEVWCLGDSFHDADGAARLSDEARHMLTAMVGAHRWHWITGNHDADVGDAMGGCILPEAAVDGLILRHEAQPGDPRPELSGHFHPKLRVQVRGRQVARRCFVASDRKLILPAFGALTGGLDAAHPAITAALGRSGEAWVPLDDRLLRFPLAA